MRYNKPAYDEIVDILCRRDGLLPRDARELLDDTLAEMEGSEWWEWEDIFQDNLQLEPDYLIRLFL